MEYAAILKAISSHPFVPLRVHLRSGNTEDIRFEGTAYVRLSELLIVFPRHADTCEIDGYRTIALKLIKRIEKLPGSARQRRKKAS